MVLFLYFIARSKAGLYSLWRTRMTALSVSWASTGISRDARTGVSVNARQIAPPMANA